MCGIAGIWNFNRETLSEIKLKDFTDSMLHRGPDGGGYELLNDNALGLGHRRLSILDLSDAGKQPFYYLDRYWITYNGEVFNFQEIKTDLEKQGHTFRTSTDTEIIVAAYAHYGINCQDYFNGMWAFAIWDSHEKTMFLSRDRFGVKPLYYSEKNNQFFFASETRAFKYLDGFNREFDKALLDIEMKDPYSLEGLGYTVFKDIRQLLPGHYMLIKGPGDISQRRWWHIEDHLKKNIKKLDLKQQAEAFYEIFRDACRIRLISDVPVATALSGGLDSTAIYSTVYDILRQETNSRVNKNSQLAVSAIFPGLENDEKSYVEQALSYTGGQVRWIETDYTNLASQIEIDTELFDSISTAPITAISSIYRGMKQSGITVSLDGHGVDEMLYGYLDTVYELYNEAVRNNSVHGIQSIGHTLRDLYHPDAKADVYARFNGEIEKSSALAARPFRKIRQMIKAILPAKKDTRCLPVSLPPLSDKPYDFSDKPFEERVLYYEFFQHTLPSLLRNFDRAAMMNSVEIRMPFMDWRLVTFIFSLPFESKIGQAYTKRVLREAMKGRMAESIRTRTHKIGIGSPASHWFDNYLKEWISEKGNTTQLFDKTEIKEQLSEYYRIGNPALISGVWKKINADMII